MILRRAIKHIMLFDSYYKYVFNPDFLYSTTALPQPYIQSQFKTQFSFAKRTNFLREKYICIFPRHYNLHNFLYVLLFILEKKGQFSTFLKKDLPLVIENIKTSNSGYFPLMRTYLFDQSINISAFLISNRWSFSLMRTRQMSQTKYL